MQRNRFFTVFLPACACVTLLAAVRGQGTLPPSQEQVSNSNLKQIGLGLLMYTQDFDEKLPPMQSAATFKKVVRPYLKTEAGFHSARDQEALSA